MEEQLKGTLEVSWKWSLRQRVRVLGYILKTNINKAVTCSRLRTCFTRTSFVFIGIMQ